MTTTTTTAAATADDFAMWRKLSRDMSSEQIRWAIYDCRKAAEAMKGWNPVKEGFYEDQAFTYADELRSRMSKRGR